MNGTSGLSRSSSSAPKPPSSTVARAARRYLFRRASRSAQPRAACRPIRNASPPATAAERLIVRNAVAGGKTVPAATLIAAPLTSSSARAM